jgi:hypothetical protein
MPFVDANDPLLLVYHDQEWGVPARMRSSLAGTSTRTNMVGPPQRVATSGPAFGIAVNADQHRQCTPAVVAPNDHDSMHLLGLRPEQDYSHPNFSARS